MRIDILSTLVGLLGGSGIVAVLWAYAVRNPEKVLRVAAMLYHFFARWFRAADRRYVATDIEANVASAVRQLRHEAPGTVPLGLRIEWHAAIEPDVFVDKNYVVFRFNYYGDQDRNLAHAVWAYVPRAVIPEARHYLDQNVQESLDLTLAKRMLTHTGDTNSINYFFHEYLVPAIRANPDLAEICSCLDRLDDMGWLTRILLLEFFEVGKTRFPNTPNGTEARETAKFIRFLDNVAKREHGEDVSPTFGGDHVSMSIVFVARADVRKAYGTWPHFAWIKRAKEQGIHRFYICALGKNIGPARGLSKNAARELDLEIVATHVYRGRFFRRRRTAVCIVCRASESEPAREEESEPNSVL